MKAVGFVDNQIVVAERPDPVPGTGELLVRVRAAGLNRADQLQLLGLYPAPPGSPPDIPGLELAGEVVGIGPSVFRFSTGDRVLAVIGGGPRRSWPWCTNASPCRCPTASTGCRAAPSPSRR